MYDRSRDVLAMTGHDLETFIRTWIGFHVGSSYFRVDRFSGAHDLGRDVVGFLTRNLHEGPWDNFQCKQLAGTLTGPEFLEEIGKIFWHASRGEYTPPHRYVFVAPNNADRTVKHLVSNPSKLKARLLSDWDKACAKRISKGRTIDLTPEIRSLIEAYDFARVEVMTNSAIMSAKGMKETLSIHFGDDPGEAPHGEVPGEFQPEERKYLEQLVELYGEAEGAPFVDESSVMRHPRHGGHLQMQRERFFDGVAFRKKFREPLFEPHLAHVEREVRSGVYEAFEGSTGLARVTEVMKAAATYSPSGLFANHGRLSVTVRQGTCHHLANVHDTWAWNRK